MAYPRLSPQAVRNAPLRRTRWRSGVDADQVRALLARVADELDVMNRDVAVLRAENDRIKRALRDWQTGNGRRNGGHWPGSGGSG